MTIAEIKQAVDEGLTVHWKNNAYIVDKWKNNYNIVCTRNNDAIGLTNLAGDKLNGSEKDFYIGE